MTEFDPLLTVKLIAHPFMGAPMADLERDALVAIIREVEQLRTTVTDLEVRLEVARAEAHLWEQAAHRD